MSKRTLTIRNLVTGEVDTVIDVTGKSESQVEKIERGPVDPSVFALPEGYTRIRGPAGAQP